MLGFSVRYIPFCSSACESGSASSFLLEECAAVPYTQNSEKVFIASLILISIWSDDAVTFFPFNHSIHYLLSTSKAPLVLFPSFLLLDGGYLLKYSYNNH